MLWRDVAVSSDGSHTLADAHAFYPSVAIDGGMSRQIFPRICERISSAINRAAIRPSDVALFREPRDGIACAERQRLDRHRRLTAPARHEARPIDDEQVFHVVRT